MSNPTLTAAYGAHSHYPLCRNHGAWRNKDMGGSGGATSAMSFCTLPCHSGKIDFSLCLSTRATDHSCDWEGFFAITCTPRSRRSSHFCKCLSTQTQ